MQSAPLLSAFSSLACIEGLASLSSILIPVLISLLGFLVVFSVERYKMELLRNQKKEKVAELFGYIPSLIGGHKLSASENQKVNQLFLEVALYLPYKLNCRVADCMAGKNGLNYKDVFIEVRRHILEKKDIKPDELKGENLLHIKYEKPDPDGSGQ